LTFPLYVPVRTASAYGAVVSAPAYRPSAQSSARATPEMSVTPPRPEVNVPRTRAEAAGLIEAVVGPSLSTTTFRTSSVRLPARSSAITRISPLAGGTMVAAHVDVSPSCVIGVPLAVTRSWSPLDAAV
jgi:hypothetical protein